MANPHHLSGIQFDVATVPLPEGIVFEQNVGVVMRDGVRLSVNVFRPTDSGPCPAIMAISPYGKDDFNGYELFSRVEGNHIGHIRTSDHTSFEAADPATWVPRGYVVIQADTRGQGQSEGNTNGFSPEEQEDYCELIDWASKQPWCTGKVGLIGVSYLAITQWGVAQHNPPALAAIIPWEGWNDAYLRSYFNGIPEIAFRSFVREGQIIPHHNPNSNYVLPKPGNAPFDHPLRDEFWDAQAIHLEKINVPALICASFSDQGLHTRDTFEGYKRIASSQKWLFSHRRPKWDAFYSAEAVEAQTAFFDRFLKDIDNGFQDRPRVRLEINEDRTRNEVHLADAWPLANTKPLKLSLDATNSRLVPSDAALNESRAELGIGAPGAAQFDLVVESDTTFVGNACLRLWIECQGSDDVDLFVALKKLDRAKNEVFFYGFGGTNANDGIARGWLRASHRELDQTKSTALQPVQSNRRKLKLQPQTIVPVDVELLPSATLFRQGETLRITVQTRPIEPDASILKFNFISSEGKCIIHCGGAYDSHLLLPLIES